MPHKTNYWMDAQPLRAHPCHGFTVKTLFKKRLAENTSSAALALYLITPFLQKVDQEVRILAEKDEDPTAEDLKPLLMHSAKHAGVNFATVGCKVAVQAGVSAMLIERDTPLSNSIVYHADMYPRLHQKFVGDLLQKLWLPRSLAAAMGPKTQAADLQVINANVSTLACAQDSCKRHVIATIANITVANGLTTIHFLTGGQKKDKQTRAKDTKAYFNQIVWNFIDNIQALSGTILGAAVGHLVGGGVGEYWGEYVGPTVTSLSIMYYRNKIAKKAHK